MTTYQLTLTKKQAQTIQAACELYERLHAGQWFALEDILPLKEGIYWHDLEHHFKNVIEPYCDTSKMKFERISGDIMQVIRHHLAWEEHPEGGDTVNFRTPLKMGGEPLVKMKGINDIPLLSDDIQTMMINHVRYGLTRQSYMVGIVIKDVKKYWDVLSNNTKNTIRQDVAEKINDYLTRLEDSENQKPFWTTDFHSWQDLHNWMNANA